MKAESSEISVQNRVADYYVNSRYTGYSLQYHTSIIEKMMEGAHGRILDVGCGTGLISLLYPELDITGIDVSPGMLRHHKGKHILASVEKMPFRNNHFDFVVCRSVLHHLPDIRAGLREIRRVLKPGGKLVCWETNKGWLAHIVRSVTQHGDHFSEYHAKEGVLAPIRDYFNVSNVKFGGFLGYLLCGFPDIVKIPRVITAHWKTLMKADDGIPQWLMEKIGFYVMVIAKK